jgi:hypothetical protein
MHTFLLGKTEEKKLLGITKHRWKENIKTDLTETGCRNVELDSSGSG